MQFKTQLTLGVASAAMASGLATPASAACTVDGASVNCTADSTAAEVNAAMASVAPGDVTLTVTDGANVVQPGGPVQPTQQGAVTIQNAGTIGAEDAFLNVTYTGTPTEAGNTFDLTNSGTIFGSVSVNNVGGDTTIDNSGLIADGVNVFTNSAANISFTSTGTVESTAGTAISLDTNGGDVDVSIEGNVGTVATETDDSALRRVAALSERFSASGETETETVDTVTTTTTTSNQAIAGGSVSVEVGADANTGAILAAGVSGASVNVDGTVGSETQQLNVTARATGFERQQTDIATVDGTDSSFSSTIVLTATGGEAEVAIGQTGSVSGAVTANGFGGATVSIDGSVGTEDAPRNVFVFSSGDDTVLIDENATVGDVITSNSSQAFTDVGGQGSVTVGETGTVSGGIFVQAIGGADVVVDGSVGSEDAPSFVFVESRGSESIATQESTFNTATGASSSLDTFTTASNGGNVSIAVGEPGEVIGGVTASANGDSTITNAGVIAFSVDAGATGSSFTSTSEFTDDGEGSTTSSFESGSIDTGGTATITNAAGALIGLDATAPISVSAFGNTAADITNAGRINGNVSVGSAAFESADFDSNSEQVSTDADTGVVTTVETFASAESDINRGGDATFTNAAGGLITGNVSVEGTGSATVTNNGAVIGTTFASSTATDTVSQSTFTRTTVFTPSDDGGGDGGEEGPTVLAGSTTVTFEGSESEIITSSGGDVVGVYAGTNGAVQFAPFGGASDGSVTQVADGNSVATVTGSIFGDFSGTAAGEEFTTNVVFAGSSTTDADGDLLAANNEYAYEETLRTSDSDSSLVVSEGTIEGSANLFATGSASAQIADGGTIEGDLDLTAQDFAGYDYAEIGSSSQIRDEDGVLISNEDVFESASESFVNAGTVTVSITDGTVGGDVFMSGAAGASTFTLGEEGTVGGSVSQISDSSSFISAVSRTTVRTADASGDIDTVITTEQTNIRIASGGNVTAVVAGTIGNGEDEPQEYGDVESAFGPGLTLSTDAGNGSATVTGQVRGDIELLIFGSDSETSFQQTTVNGALTAFASQSTTTATGGTATLVVDADDIDSPANFGDIYVAGRSGSTVTIGENSTVLAATDGAFLQVGDLFFDSATTREDTYTDTTLTGQVETSEFTAVGGPATLTNNGRIGFDGGEDFDGDDAEVLVLSVTEARATNNGQIYGSIDVISGFVNQSTTTTRTDMDDVTRVDITETVYTPVGGNATLTNNGLITGDASVAGAVGTVTNNGVLRGNLTLGASVDNYTTRSTDTLTQLGEEEVVEVSPLALQTYAVAQNGLLGGTIFVEGAFGILDDEIQTSDITANIALNSGSVTGGGVVAEFDDETGERFTTTNVTLNGSGFLGLGDTALARLEDAFGDIDPAIEDEGDLSAFAGGARVLGVETLTKTGAGVFLITGADFEPASNTNRFADYTLDIGTFNIAAGEIQLATASDDGVFGIRGNITNGGTLVLGSRVQIPAPLFGINQSVTAIDGVEVYQQGNFAQSGTGTLVVGITPSLVRVVDPAFAGVSTSTNPLAVQQISLASGLFTTPERALGQAFNGLGTGFLTVDGNMNLGGTVQLVSPTGGIFTDGQRVDFASVSGTVTTGANVVINRPSNFVTFGLGTRAEGGRTIVFASADRTGFETVANNQNAVAAGTALSAALPGIVSTIQAASAGGIGLGGDQFVLAQDLANIFVGFDSLLTRDQVTAALNDLASGEIYGSITTLETTAPFVDAITAPRIPVGASGFNMWFAPSGDFIEIDGDADVGSSDLDADNYGASAGFGVATGNGEFGVGFGYGRIAADARDGLLAAEADTLMIGLYARQAFGNFSVGADLVYGWSDWFASRTMPTLSRVAQAEFDSTELRGSLRADYTFDFGGGWVAPFAQVIFRKFDFDGFTEEGAGSVNLVVEDAEETIVQPVLGLRAGTMFETGLAKLRPEFSASYTFNEDQESFRDVAFLGAPANSFRLQGVEPEGFVTLGLGLFADIGQNSGAFVRGNYATGGGLNVTSLNAGVTIGF